LLLSGEQPRQPKKSANPSPSENKKGVEATPQKQPADTKSQPSSQLYLPPIGRSGALPGEAVIEELLLTDDREQSAAPDARDILFGQESVGEHTSDHTLDSAVAAIAVFYMAGERHGDKRKSDKSRNANS